MEFRYLLIAYAPSVGFAVALIALAVAFRIIIPRGKGCSDCGARLGFTEGTHCHHCTGLKRSILQAHGDRDKKRLRDND